MSRNTIDANGQVPVARTTSAVRPYFCSIVLSVSLAAVACSDGNGKSEGGFGGAGSGGTGSGGRSGVGGEVSTGGAVRTGGSQGSGGLSSSGGASGLAGAPATGGASAAGGASGVGGKTGSGGTTSGGASGDGGRGDAAVSSADAPMDTVTSKSDAVRSDVVAAPETTPPSCSKAPPNAGDATATLQHGGRSRKYILHVPSGLTSGSALAVVLDLHGAGGNGSQQKGMSGFSALADKEKFLAVFPDGIDGYWNVDDKCCGTAGKEKIDDVGFLKAIVAKLQADTCIDAKRIYVSGFSNGGGLAHRMGCDAADVIAAIAPVATDLRTQPCNATRPISMMEIRGMADSLEPYEGGIVGPEGGQYLAVGAKASLKLWADIDKCTGTPTTLDKYCESYTQCAEGVEADLCSLPNVDHSPYSNSIGFNLATTVWKMFQRQPMR